MLISLVRLRYFRLLATSSARDLKHRRGTAEIKSVLGAGLEPACLSAYAPQTYVSAIPPPEHYGQA